MPESKHRRNRRPRNLEIPRTTNRRGGTNKLLLIASIIIAVLVIAGFSIPTLIDSISGPSDLTLGTAEAYVEGVGEKQEIMRTKLHVDLNDTNADDDVAYSTVPPTSGDHWGTPGRCGFYNDPIPDEVVVHNLEHSNIVISYNLPNPADVDQLRDFMDGFDLAPDWAVTRFYDKIPEGTVALSTWGVLDEMVGVDEDRIERFFDAYAGRLGPEFPNGAPCAVTGVMS